MRPTHFPTMDFVDIRPPRVLPPGGSPSPRSDNELLYLPTFRQISFLRSREAFKAIWSGNYLDCLRHDCIVCCIVCSSANTSLRFLGYLYYERRNIKIKGSTKGEKKTSDNGPSYDLARGLVQGKRRHLLSSAVARRIKAPPARNCNARPEDSGRVKVNGSDLEDADFTELGDKPVPSSDFYEARGKDGLVAWKSGPGRSKEWRRSSYTKEKTRRQRCRDKECRRDQRRGGRRPADSHQVARQEPVMMLKSRSDFKPGTHARRSKRRFSPRQKHFELEEDGVGLVQDIQE